MSACIALKKLKTLESFMDDNKRHSDIVEELKNYIFSMELIQDLCDT